jgi:cathepsin C
MCFYGSCYNNKVIGEADFKEDHKYTVSIADPNVVVTTDQHGKKEKGTWTTVYDEGFEVDTPSKHFFAFSKFGGGQSLCKQTWPGWHREANNPDSNRWGCYQGNKISEDVSEEDLAFLTVEERRAHEDSIASIQIEESPAATTAYELPTEATSTKMYQPEHEMVARINAKEGGTWKAKVYPEFEKMTMAAFQNIAGFRPSRRLPRDNRPPRPSDSEELIQVPDASNLPETLDWRNMDGVNYVDDVVNQGQCGSCYAVVHH